MRRIMTLTTLLVAATFACTKAPSYDLVITNGRVMDPESGLDGVRNVGISAGKIAAISEQPLAGTRVIDAKNDVVAPGFIDLHEHGQSEEAYRMMVRDGVTTALEIEVGVGDNASAHIHMRNGVPGLDSTIAAAKAAGAKLHIVHVNSVSDTSLTTFLTRIKAADDAGQDVTTEAYPYGAGMTSIQSALFDDWKTWPDAKFRSR